VKALNFWGIIVLIVMGLGIGFATILPVERDRWMVLLLLLAALVSAYVAGLEMGKQTMADRLRVLETLRRLAAEGRPENSASLIRFAMLRFSVLAKKGDPLMAGAPSLSEERVHSTLTELERAGAVTSRWEYHDGQQGASRHGVQHHRLAAPDDQTLPSS
jgi:hypothetical protein